MKLTIELPWPSTKLHPNGRVHHMAKSKAAKKAREDAFFCTRHALGTNYRVFEKGKRIPVELTFYPPHNRRRDHDGMIAALKSSLDGVADALKVNDHQFQLGAPRVLEVVKHGKVIVEIE